jgi:hypothetical protein
VASIDKYGRLTTKFKSDWCDLLGGGGSYDATNTVTASEEDMIPFEFQDTSGLSLSPIDNGKRIRVEIFGDKFGQ